MGARIEVHGGTATVTGRREAEGRAGDGDRPARQRQPDPRRPRRRGRDPGGARLPPRPRLRAGRGEALGLRRARSSGCTSARMTEDARFEDGAERPLRLRAETRRGPGGDLGAAAGRGRRRPPRSPGLPRRRRFTALLNRFRWEDAAARRAPGPAVRAGAGAPRRRGRAAGARERRRSRATATWCWRCSRSASSRARTAPASLRLTLAGDGEIALEVECLDVTLADVTPALPRPARRPRRSHPRD